MHQKQPKKCVNALARQWGRDSYATAGGNHWTCCLQKQSKNYKKYTKKKNAVNSYLLVLFIIIFLLSHAYARTVVRILRR